jgi:hypothetical protein
MEVTSNVVIVLSSLTPLKSTFTPARIDDIRPPLKVGL